MLSMVLSTALLSAVLLLPQTPSTAPPASTQKPAPSSMTMSGCVDAKRGATGDIRFLDEKTGTAYRLSGKGLDKHLGQHVEITGGSRGKGLTVRGGLWPSPNAAAQSGGGLDPAQESIARQRGGGGTGVGPTLQEFPVTRVRALAGSCQ
jgi:hypothetical protein